MITLRDRNEHNIHDPYAADNKRDCCYQCQHPGDDHKERAGRMGDLVTIGNGEILIAEFLISEGSFNIRGNLGKGISVGGFNIDLLDLNRTGDFIHGFGIHDEGIIEVDIVEVNGFVDFIEDTDNHEFFAHNSNCLADGAVDCIK